MKILLICVTIIFLASCEFKNEEELFPPDCDTLNISYSKVEPIFKSSCVSCHNETVNNRGIKLHNFTEAKAAAQTGLLKKAVNHESDVTPMPYMSAKLDSCSVRKITIWIEKNTPQ